MLKPRRISVQIVGSMILLNDSALDSAIQVLKHSDRDQRICRMTCTGEAEAETACESLGIYCGFVQVTVTTARQ